MKDEPEFILHPSSFGWRTDTMPEPGTILRELHRLRRHVRELESRSEQGPRAKKAQQDRLARHEEALKRAQDELKHLKVHIHEKEVSIKSAHEQVKRYEKQLKENITSKKEFDALTAEIAHTRATIGQLEDEALEAMADSEERAAKLPEQEAELRRAREDFARFDQDQADKLRRWAEEKARAQEELRSAEATLPADVRPLYDRLVTAKGPDALAAVAGSTCTACYTEVTPQMSSELRRGVFMLCKNCGRMLYTQ
jgi:predicted  nucleic acid-binding Zn-ribbon protein